MNNLERIIFNLEKYLIVSKENLGNIEWRYTYSLINWFDEDDIFWYELKLTEVSERIRAALDSALFTILDKDNDLTENQKKAIKFCKEYGINKDKRLCNLEHNSSMDFHTSILEMDKWWVIHSIIDDTNVSKHRFFQVQIESIIGKVLVVHDKSQALAVIPYTFNTVKWQCNFGKISVWMKNSIIELNPKSKVQIIWDIDLNNWIKPKIIWAKSFTQNRALIRMEIKGNSSKIPWNTFYLDYYKYLIDIVSNVLDYLKRNNKG